MIEPRQMTILIIDNDDLIRQTYKRGIQTHSNHKFIFLEASNGLEGLQLAQKDQPDIILTDYEMPLMTGLELIRQLQNNNNKTPIILITGDHCHIEISLRAGANFAFLKPCDTKELTRIIHLLLF